MMVAMSLIMVSSNIKGRRLAGSWPSFRGFGMQLSLPSSQPGSGRSYSQNSWMATSSTASQGLFSLWGWWRTRILLAQKSLVGLWGLA